MEMPKIVDIGGNICKKTKNPEQNVMHLSTKVKHGLIFMIQQE